MPIKCKSLQTINFAKDASGGGLFRLQKFCISAGSVVDSVDYLLSDKFYSMCSKEHIVCAVYPYVAGSLPLLACENFNCLSPEFISPCLSVFFYFFSSACTPSLLQTQVYRTIYPLYLARDN